MTHILIVEDELRLRRDLVDFLVLCGFSAEGVATAEELRQTLADGEQPDIIILDIGLPDGNGFDLANEIRSVHHCGIIMLTALGESDDRIRGFESGADIYLVKHSTLREIEAATRSLLRRTEAQGEKSDSAGETWILNSKNWTLLAPNQHAITLTATEFALLNTLFENGGDVCDREKLAATIARPASHFDNRYLDAVISRLRRKIDKHTNLQAPIKVVYGVGYTFTAPAVAQ